MPIDSFREGDPTSPSTSITSDTPPVPSTGCDYDDALDSIKLCHVGPWEGAGLISLIAAPGVILVIGYMLRTGRDLSIPVLAGNAMVLVVGIVLAGIGYRQCDRLRQGIGVITVLIVLCGGFFCVNGVLWCGSTNVEFTILVADTTTGKPIPGAIVVLSEKEGPKVVAQTDPDGTAHVTYRCFTSGTTTPVCQTGGASFSFIIMKVTADGYLEFEKPLRRIAGPGWALYGPPPPPIEVRLTPKQ